MSALVVRLDERTSRHLEELSRSEGVGTEDYAARLLRRAVLAARPRRRFDPEHVRRSNAGFEQEDIALAESGAEERCRSLEAEDAACGGGRSGLSTSGSPPAPSRPAGDRRSSSRRTALSRD
jgi:hypothetical protein